MATGRLGPYELDTVVCGDCLQVMARMPDGCADLIFCDWPYNLRKAAWDSGFDWRPIIPELVRVLKFNGALWVILGNPLELTDVSRAIVEAGGPPLVNWITWDKYNDNPTHQACGGPMVGMTEIKGLRSFQRMAEYLIYHADDGQWQRQTDKVRGFIFEPLRAYLEGERKRARLSRRAIDDACGTSNVSQYWWQERGWRLPMAHHYETLRRLAPGCFGREYENLRREYEGLRREYEDLRPTFNNPGKVSSVWPGPPAKKNGHETPKPEWLLERIIEMTSNAGDLVCDFFMGSGTTAVAAKKLGRHWFGCDIAEGYVAMANKRLARIDGIQLPLLNGRQDKTL